MIDIKHLIAHPEVYQKSLTMRGKSPALVDDFVTAYHAYHDQLRTLEQQRAETNAASKQIVSLQGDERAQLLEKMKTHKKEISVLEEEVSVKKKELDILVKKIPNHVSDQTPEGKNDTDNIVTQEFGAPKSDMPKDIKKYRELNVYKKYVAQKEGVDAMGARGYYLTGEMARFQKVLMDWSLDHFMKNGYDLMYVPLMLNESVLTGTGHLPDFDGQQYETQITDSTSYYLIGSSEPSIMGYYMGKNLGTLEKPLCLTAHTTCFRKESGSYGKDQQGILRVHQFEKVEIVIICKPEDVDACFALQTRMNEEIRGALDLHYRRVEVCAGDMPGKHTRQADYEAYFPATDEFREIGSNGNAGDYQNRGLKIQYTNKEGKKAIPYGLNDTGMTFRTGLAIMEQNQTEDGRVKIPNVLVERFGKEYLE